MYGGGARYGLGVIPNVGAFTISPAQPFAGPGQQTITVTGAGLHDGLNLAAYADGAGPSFPTSAAPLENVSADGTHATAVLDFQGVAGRWQVSLIDPTKSGADARSDYLTITVSSGSGGITPTPAVDTSAELAWIAALARGSITLPTGLTVPREAIAEGPINLPDGMSYAIVRGLPSNPTPDNLSVIWWQSSAFRQPAAVVQRLAPGVAPAGVCGAYTSSSPDADGLFTWNGITIGTGEWYVVGALGGDCPAPPAGWVSDGFRLVSARALASLLAGPSPIRASSMAPPNLYQSAPPTPVPVTLAPSSAPSSSSAPSATTPAPVTIPAPLYQSPSVVAAPSVAPSVQIMLPPLYQSPTSVGPGDQGDTAAPAPATTLGDGQDGLWIALGLAVVGAIGYAATRKHPRRREF